MSMHIVGVSTIRWPPHPTFDLRSVQRLGPPLHAMAEGEKEYLR
jgi:hypothetical protein